MGLTLVARMATRTSPAAGSGRVTSARVRGDPHSSCRAARMGLVPGCLAPTITAASFVHKETDLSLYSTRKPPRARSAGGDVVGQRRHGADDLVDQVGRDAGGGERIGQMTGDEAEMFHGDPAPLVYLLHRGAAVGVGTAERGGEELDLLAAQAIHVGPAEETGRIVIGQHAGVEVGDHGFERFVAADAVEDRGGGLGRWLRIRFGWSAHTPLHQPDIAPP